MILKKAVRCIHLGVNSKGSEMKIFEKKYLGKKNLSERVLHRKIQEFTEKSGFIQINTKWHRKKAISLRKKNPKYYF